MAACIKSLAVGPFNIDTIHVVLVRWISLQYGRMLTLQFECRIVRWCLAVAILAGTRQIKQMPLSLDCSVCLAPMLMDFALLPKVKVADSRCFVF